jgi:serine/threonine protein kinase
LSALQQQLQTTLGDAYRLEGELGGGGMSRVFVALETALGRKVVIKVLLPELAAGVSVDRFRREIQLAAQLQHPHIVPLLSAGEFQGLPYFIMPFVSGESLRARMMRSGELPIPESVRILRDVVSALAYAHSFGVVHRDIKPDNVLISGGVAVVTDFGVAKAVTASSGSSAPALTSLGLALGTPAYMAPEQASGDAHVDHRADIYALGVMAYEMLSGRPLFPGRPLQAVLAAHVIETPEPVDRLRPAVSPLLASLVMSCLAKRPADRPQSGTDVLHALDAIATPVSGTARTTAVSVPAIGTGRPGRGGMIAVTVGLVAVLALGGLLWSRRSSRTPVSTAGTTTAARADTPDTRPSPVSPPMVVAPPRVAQTPPPRTPPIHRADTTARKSPKRPPPAVLRSRLPPDTEQVAQEAANPSDSSPGSPDTAPASAPEPPLAPAVAAPAAGIPTPPPAPDRQADMRGLVDVIAEYARAVESESIDNLKRVYPGMTAEQQKGWEQFFGTVRDIKSQLNIQRADISGDVGSALVAGSYTYMNGSTRRTEQQQVSFRAIMHRSGGAWRIIEVH